MIIKNKLDKVFGPFGSFAGIVILLFGIYAVFYSWIGLTTIVVGAFLAFSNTGSIIDFENKKIKFSNNLFGLISIGYWIEVKPNMNLKVLNVSKVNTTNSQCNKTSVSKSQDYRIILFSADDKQLMVLKKFKVKEDASKELVEYGKKLDLVK